MSNQIVATNQWLNDRCASARATLNVGHYLHLFQNNVTPDPTYVLPITFVECNFDTYPPGGVGLSGAFGVPVKIIEGEYQSEAGPITFNSPAAVPNVIYGWWIDDGVHVKLAYRFDSPINFTVAAPAFTLTIDFQDFAKSIL